MGQARVRGSREERINQAIRRDRALQEKKDRARVEYLAKEKERVATLPEEQQKRYYENKSNKQVRMEMVLGLVSALSSIPPEERNLVVSKREDRK